MLLSPRVSIYIREFGRENKSKEDVRKVAMEGKTSVAMHVNGFTLIPTSSLICKRARYVTRIVIYAAHGF